MISLFVVCSQKFRGVGRIEIGEIDLDLGQDLVDILTESLAFLAVVEDQGVDAGHVLAEAVLELLGGVFAFAVTDRRREVTEAALARHTGLAQGEQSQVFLEAREPVGIGPDCIDQTVDTLGEKDALEVVADEAPGLGVVGQQCLQILITEADAVVFDDRPGGVMAVMETVIGKNPQAFGLEHVSHDSRPGKGVNHRGHSVRGVLPNPIDQLLLRADVIGDVFGPFLRWPFLRDIAR